MNVIKTEILGISVDAVTKGEALKILLGFLSDGGNHTLFTPNPEFALIARKDPLFKEILNAGDLVVPDGIGILLASKLNRIKIAERVTGCDLMLSLFDAVKDKGVTVYLLGGKPGVAEKAKLNLEAKYGGLTVAGFADGYFDTKKERIILREIQRLKPDILLVCLAAPKQEKWVNQHKSRLNAKISACLGGSIDVYAGTVKRAPAALRKLCLEWLWRLVTEPKRALRIYKLPLFVVLVLADALKKRFAKKG